MLFEEAGNRVAIVIHLPNIEIGYIKKRLKIRVIDIRKYSDSRMREYKIHKKR